ncbi:OLC1v1006587C1 [Oldenlandia corymbosa var. corymbosa]|uniref:OLC1v1006587C1 n=1 Tax=Oldenlandia corymbosa var. corymbosa TaxID=529605 RepID=A0AAV1DHF8_OLDCO|nr:OLC1v1006587C1 [Oldenlandia corymbosa var. corymbosa]
MERKVVEQGSNPLNDSGQLRHHIPYDIIFDVLTRLPAKNLMRFKTVCKSWNSLICDPYFADIHHTDSLARRPESSYLLFHLVRGSGFSLRHAKAITCVDGAIFFLNHEMVLQYFEVGVEEFKVLPLHDDMLEYQFDFVSQTGIGGKLTLASFRNSNGNGQSFITLWTLTNRSGINL